MIKNRIKWKKEIKPIVLDALRTNPDERFPNIRSVWYYLWSALQLIPATTVTYKKTDKLLVEMRKEGLVSFGRFRLERGINGNSGEIALDPGSIVENAIDRILELGEDYELPWLYDQPYVIEVWVEKAGLVPTFEKLCEPYDIKVRSPQGFTPWEFTKHAVDELEKDYFPQRKTKHFKTIYFGDQDPSGESIFDAIVEQLDFFGIDHDTKRIGVTVPQIAQYNLPETPTDPETLKKIRRDPRYQKYIEKYSEEIFCEIDAFISLAYDEFKTLFVNTIEKLIDKDALKERKELNEKTKKVITETIDEDREELEKIKGNIIEHLND